MVPKQAKVAMMIEITKEAKITTNISSLTKHVLSQNYLLPTGFLSWNVALKPNTFHLLSR